MPCSFGRTEIFVDEENLRRNIGYSEQISLTYAEIYADPNLMGSALFGYIIRRKSVYHQGRQHRPCISSRESVYNLPCGLMIYNGKPLVKFRFDFR